MHPVILTSIQHAGQLYLLDDLIKNATEQLSGFGIIPTFLVECPFKLNRNDVKQLDAPFSFNTLPSFSYIIKQDITVRVKHPTYQWIHNEMVHGAKAILFHFQNDIYRYDCWRTDFFVATDDKYFPRRGENAEHDIFEVSWGKYLIQNSINDFIKSHNSSERKFEFVNIPKIDIVPVLLTSESVINREIVINSGNIDKLVEINNQITPWYLSWWNKLKGSIYG